MKCDKCNNEANIEVYIMNEGKDLKISLCFDCYEEIVSLSLQEFMAGNVLEFLNKVLPDLNSAIFDEYLIDESAACPKCNKTIRDIIDEDKYGCDYCYSEFEPQVSKIQALKDKREGLEDLNEGENSPSDLFEQIKSLKEEIEDKKKLLNDSVYKEDYEKAQEIKMDIEGLSTRLKTLVIETND